MSRSSTAYATDFTPLTTDQHSRLLKALHHRAPSIRLREFCRGYRVLTACLFCHRPHCSFVLETRTYGCHRERCGAHYVYQKDWYGPEEERPRGIRWTDWADAKFRNGEPEEVQVARKQTKRHDIETVYALRSLFCLLGSLSVEVIEAVVRQSEALVEVAMQMRAQTALRFVDPRAIPQLLAPLPLHTRAHPGTAHWNLNSAPSASPPPPGGREVVAIQFRRISARLAWLAGQSRRVILRWAQRALLDLVPTTAPRLRGVGHPVKAWELAPGLARAFVALARPVAALRRAFYRVKEAFTDLFRGATTTTPRTRPRSVLAGIREAAAVLFAPLRR